MAIKNGSSGTGGVSSSTSTKTESSSAVKTGSSAVGGASNTSSAKTTNTASTGNTKNPASSSPTASSPKTTTTTSSAPKTSTTSLASSAGTSNKNTSSNVSPSVSGSTSGGSGYVGGTASAVSGSSGTNKSPSTAAYVGGSSGGGGGGTSPVRAATSAVGGASGTDTTYIDVGLGSAAKGSWGTTPAVSGSTGGGRGLDAAATSSTRALANAAAGAAGIAAAAKQQGWLPYQSAAGQPRVRELGFSYDGEGVNPNKVQDRLPEGYWPTTTPYEGWRADGGDFPAMPLVSNLTASRGANGANDNLNMMLAAMSGRNINASPRDGVGAGPGGWAQYDDYITDQMLTGAAPAWQPTVGTMFAPAGGGMPAARANNAGAHDGMQMMLDALTDARVGGPTVAGRPEYPGALPAAPWMPTVAGRQETPGGLPGASWMPTVAGRPGYPAGMPGAPWGGTTIAGRPEYPGGMPAAPSPRDGVGPGAGTFEQLDDFVHDGRWQPSVGTMFAPVGGGMPAARSRSGAESPINAIIADEPDRFDSVKVLEDLAASRAATTPKTGLGINGGYDNANMMIGNMAGVHAPSTSNRKIGVAQGTEMYGPPDPINAGVFEEIGAPARLPRDLGALPIGLIPNMIPQSTIRAGLDERGGYVNNDGEQIESLPGQVEFERQAETETPSKSGKSSIKEDSGIIVTTGDLDKLKKDNDPVGKWFNSTPLGVIIDFLNGDEEDAGGGTPWFEGMFGKGGDPSKAPVPLVDPVVGGSYAGSSGGGGGTPVTPGTPGTGSYQWDANGNGIPDFLEGLFPGGIPGLPGTTPTPKPNNPNNTSGVYDRFGDVVFPALPPYNPGVDPEHLYFRKRAFADGGLVDAYAEGGTVTGLDMQDPRVETIAKAEDALEDIVAGRQPSAEERKALEDFAAQFGQEALKSLYQNVQSGMTMKGKPRMVEGPGGPQDDAIPARVENVEEAALSNGEFVMPAEAVAEMGEGDPMVGARRLQELSERLTGARRQPEVNVERVS